MVLTWCKFEYCMIKKGQKECLLNDNIEPCLGINTMETQ